MLFVFGISVYYSWAISLGIASAHEDKHQFTSPSHWGLFMRKFKPHGIWIAVGLVPWILYGNAMRRYAFLARFWDAVLAFDIIDFGLHLGTIGIAFAGITLLAPRLRSPVMAALFGTLVALLPHIYIILLWEWMGINAALYHYYTIFPLSGISVFILAWLIVRFKLDRAWFRFDD